MLPLALALLLAAPQPPKAPAPPAAAPEPAKPHPYRFKVTPDTGQSLGSVGPREVRTVAYEVANVSDRPLGFRVTDLAPGTTVDGDAFDRPFAPGESRKVVLRVDPTGFVGYQRRAARLVPDDAAQPRFVFKVDMTVRPEVAPDALKKSWGAVAPHESPELTFTFTRETGDPLQVEVKSALPPHLEAALEPGPRSTTLRLTLRPRALAPGVHLGLETLEVATNAPLQPTFTLYADWKLALPVVPSPARVVFLSPEAKAQTLALASAAKKPFRILEATLEGTGFEVGPLPKGAAPRHTLRVRRVAETPSAAVLSLRIEGEPEPLKVPLAYRPPSAP